MKTATMIATGSLAAAAFGLGTGCSAGTQPESSNLEQNAAARQQAPRSSAGDAPLSPARAAASACHALLGKASTGYGPNDQNLGRELADAIDPGYASLGAVHLPGVLRTRWSSSPYDWASVLEASGWTVASNDSFDGATHGRIFVRFSGDASAADPSGFAAAHALFDAMTRATETVDRNGFTTRATAHGAVVCQHYSPTSYQCFLGPLDSLEPGHTCP